MNENSKTAEPTVARAATGSTAPSYDVDDETRDALRVVRNVVACSGLDMDDAAWTCLNIMVERFGLAEPSPGGVGPGVIPHPIDRFRGL